MPSLYERLGVSNSASTEEIRKAYKSLAREKHPDRGGNPEEFKEIQQAHEVLSDEGKRRMYDMTGSIEGQAEGGMAAGGIPFEFMRGMGPFGMPGVAFDIGSMFGGIFGGGPGGAPRRHPGKAPNKHSDIGLRLADFYKGREIKLKFSQQRRCTGCGGSGAEKSDPCAPCGGRGVRTVSRMIGPGMVAQSTGPCDVCSGEGKRVLKACVSCHGKKFQDREKELTIQIRPGMRDGETLVFAGECSDTQEFEEPGDVVLSLKRADQDSAEAAWEWRGTDLYTSVRITFAEAILGFQRNLEGHPSGQSVPVEWSGMPLVHGAVLKAPGKGMPVRDKSEFGTAYIQVLVDPPQQREWTAEEKVQLRALFGGEDLVGSADRIRLIPHTLTAKQ